VTREEWIIRFAEAAGVRRPSDEEIEELLKLAGIAAHASERTAAPLSCWMAASSDMSLAELIEAAEQLASAPAAEGA
jgi:hypothetical protein